MRMKIAVFGSQSFCDRAVQFTQQRSEVVLDLYPYSVPGETKELLKNLLPCDAILFSGSLPYVAAKDILSAIPVPFIYLKQDETEIASTLLAISIRQPLQFEQLSIDVRDEKVLQNVLADIRAEEQQPLVFQLKEDYDIEEIVDFHISAYQRGQTNCAVTSVHAAYDRLVKIGIPVHKMINVKSSFLQAIDKVCQEALLQKSETSKMTVGILTTINGPDELDDICTQLVNMLHAHCIQGDEGFLFYTTQGAIQSALRNPEFRAVTASVLGQLAFGSGHTLTEAKENAVNALRYIQTEQSDDLYLLDEKKGLHSLMHVADDAIELRMIEPVLAQVGEKTALSPAVLSKLASFGQSPQSAQFTANDLAVHLGVSRRTAERTIKKLLSFAYVKTVGEEMTYRQGRPRAVYELNFPIY